MSSLRGPNQPDPPFAVGDKVQFSPEYFALKSAHPKPQRTGAVIKTRTIIMRFGNDSLEDSNVWDSVAVKFDSGLSHEFIFYSACLFERLPPVIGS